MNRPRVDVPEDIIASLEHDLTHIDSDDEPLVQGGSDRNVVPRVGRRSSSIGFEDVGIEARRSISLTQTSGCPAMQWTPRSGRAWCPLWWT